MEYQDVHVKCVTCGRDFIFTAKEQEFFQSKGFKEPRHCRECRQQRKRDREKVIAEASGQKYEDEKGTFQVVCAQCQRETFVPFKPITGKPVLCKDCFIAQRYSTEGISETIAEKVAQPIPSPEKKIAEEQTAILEEQAAPSGPEVDLQSAAEEMPSNEEPTREAQTDQVAEEQPGETDVTTAADPVKTDAEADSKDDVDGQEAPEEESSPAIELEGKDEQPEEKSPEDTGEAGSDEDTSNQKTPVSS